MAATTAGATAGTVVDLETVYRTSGETLWRAIYAFADGQRAVADDAVAEAFARALASRTVIRDPLAWLYRTAFRIAAAELRREHPDVSPGDRETTDPPGESFEVIRALRELSPSQRAAVVLHHLADQPVREVARLMGTSASAVKVHLFRGRQRLRRLLGPEEVDDA